MSDYHGKIISFPQNRVWRSYPGGRILDQLAGLQSPKDSHFPEDWIGSTTRAINPDRESLCEGISTAVWSGGTSSFPDLIKKDPEYFLGKDHLQRYGEHPMVLVKLLDAQIRLHFQCHPTAEFAQQFLRSPSGKAEAYHILSIRDGIKEPYVYLGFQRPPSGEALRQMIIKQDIAAIESCFDKIPVQPGDTLFIPGGAPHAIGEGIFMLEIMEPSDLAVRFEFERAGYVLPESARFMQRSLDFCLDVFDYTPRSIESVRSEQMFRPGLRRKLAQRSNQYDLIDNSTTTCFSIRQTECHEALEKSEHSFYYIIVTDGELTIETKAETRILKRFDKAFIPAGLNTIKMRPLTPQGCRTVEVFPP